MKRRVGPPSSFSATGPTSAGDRRMRCQGAAPDAGAATACAASEHGDRHSVPAPRLVRLPCRLADAIRRVRRVRGPGGPAQGGDLVHRSSHRRERCPLKLRRKVFRQGGRLHTHWNVSARFVRRRSTSQIVPRRPRATRRRLLPGLPGCASSRASLPPRRHRARLCLFSPASGRRAEPARGRSMPLYECVLIARNDVTQQQVEAIADQVAATVGEAGRRGAQARVLGPARPRLPHQEEPQGALHAPRPRRAAGRRAGGAAPTRPARGRAARDDAPGGGDRRGAVRHPVPPQRGARPRPRLPRPAPGRPLQLRPRPRAERRAGGVPRPPARRDRTSPAPAAAEEQQ